MADLHVDVDGPVHVVDHGGGGAPMLLVHGLGGSLLDWSDVAGPLTRGHHVWSVDLVGFGRTPLAGRSATVTQNQEVVDRVAEHVGDGRAVVLVGNSMGGLIGIVEASRQPQRVAALVLVDPALPRVRYSRPSVALIALVVMAAPVVGPLLLRLHARRRGAEHLVDEVLSLCTVDVSRVSPATRDAEIELTRWRGEQGGDADRAMVDATRSLVRWLWRRHTLHKHILQVRAPTLLIHGDHDLVVSLAASRAVALLRPDWEFRVLSDTGHIPQLERPDSFVEVVEGWLATLQGVTPVATSSK